MTKCKMINICTDKIEGFVISETKFQMTAGTKDVFKPMNNYVKYI